MNVNLYWLDLLKNTAQEIIVDASVTKQKILGFGGAFTDAAGINIAKLSAGAQELLIK